MENTKIVEENFFKDLTPEKAQIDINELLEMKDCHPEYNYFFRNRGE